MANEELQLRVKNLPGALSGAAVTALLSHYGATRVKVLKHKRHDATQAAVAVFASQQTQQQALERLQRLELMRQKLKVEIASSKSAQQSIQQQPDTKADTVNKQTQPPLPPGPPPPLVQMPTIASPAPLAPHLGLSYAPSPLLVYKYPKATESIVRNIANALIALPKLYTQVLHLMNKMNLPPPFEDEAIPGVFSKRHEAAAASKRQKRPRSGTSAPQQQLVEEDEEGEGEGQTQDQTRPKRPRTKDENSGVPPPLPSQLSLNNAPQRKHLMEKSKRVSVFSDDVGHAFIAEQDLLMTQARRPGVISKEELRRQLLPQSELLKEPKMANYEQGATSSTVLVQNIAATADEKDLVYVFGHVLPLAFPINSLHIHLDRAANTATIEFPDDQVAAAAVDEIHGVVLEGKPLIVRYHSQVAENPSELCNTASNDSEATTNAQKSVRIDAAALNQEKAMKNYQRGEPSRVLYVKNLAKTIQMDDLSAVFGSVLPATVDSDVLNIRHFTEGRMKFQAFIEFPSIELATNALEQTHGLLVQDKPLVVCFRKSTPPTPAAP